MKPKIFLVFFITSLFSYLSAQEPVCLKVMTYNLRFGELSSLKNIADFIVENEPDFVALQELDCMTRRERTLCMVRLYLMQVVFMALVC